MLNNAKQLPWQAFNKTENNIIYMNKYLKLNICTTSQKFLNRDI